MRAIPAGSLSVRLCLGVHHCQRGYLLRGRRDAESSNAAVSASRARQRPCCIHFTKRWTLLSHLVLGWCLAIAPTGAWIAVRGALDSPVPLLLSRVVMLWTAGFDVLYACQDFDFDRREGLHSIPCAFGIAQSLWISRTLHAAAFATLVALYF
jgi:4-hydroxybenzoate polyprenyltransferase